MCALVGTAANEFDVCNRRVAFSHEFIRMGHNMSRVTATPTSYSQPPVNPARNKPATTYGQRRMRFHINPVR